MRLGDLDFLYENIKDVSKDAGFYKPIYDGFLNCIERTPTVDAVKVVRCKNCIFRDLAGAAPFMYYYCKHDKGLSDVIKDDDYCPYGAELSEGD